MPESLFDDLRAAFAQHRAGLEDYWARERSRPRHERVMRLFGREVHFLGNDAEALAAADLCRPLYSAAPPASGPPFTIRLIVSQAPVPPGRAPDNLPRLIQFAADDDWMALQLGPWGHCQIDLARLRALAVITPELGRRPELVSQWVLNTILTNLFMAAGLAMLHATCLLRGARALLLLAPHNSGKSTTALRLALSGCRLLTDSQVYLAPAETPLGLQLLGFPVGRVKLREDVALGFPQLRPFLLAEPVRHETKYTLDLRRYDPALVQGTAFAPEAIDVCLLSRGAQEAARLAPLARAEALRAVVLNSLHTHTEAVWQRNLAGLAPLVERARWHRLEIGAHAEGVLKILEELWP